MIFPEGIKVGVAQSVSYFDQFANQQITVNPISKAVTNYDYEVKLNNNKRGIYILKAMYLNIVFDDMEEMMEYKKGSTQYVSETLKRAENIRLYN